jgi:hypothetical protein
MISRNYEKGLFYYDFLYANLVFHWHFHPKKIKNKK